MFLVVFESGVWLCLAEMVRMWQSRWQENRGQGPLLMAPSPGHAVGSRNLSCSGCSRASVGQGARGPAPRRRCAGGCSRGVQGGHGARGDAGDAVVRHSITGVNKRGLRNSADEREPGRREVCQPRFDFNPIFCALALILSFLCRVVACVVELLLKCCWCWFALSSVESASSELPGWG
jgi:hypothetical protein